jgi:hypothetical protein
MFHQESHQNYEDEVDVNGGPFVQLVICQPLTSIQDEEFDSLPTSLKVSKTALAKLIELRAFFYWNHESKVDGPTTNSKCCNSSWCKMNNRTLSLCQSQLHLQKQAGEQDHSLE